MQVVAKCETRQSLMNFKAISAAADVVIIARGHLGLDVVSQGCSNLLCAQHG
jgi:pyruvate kinase